MSPCPCDGLRTRLETDCGQRPQHLSRFVHSRGVVVYGTGEGDGFRSWSYATMGGMVGLGEGARPARAVHASGVRGVDG